MTTAPTELASVRYLVDDVPAAVDFYTTHLGFTVAFASPAIAAVVRGPLRLLLSFVLLRLEVVHRLLMWR